MSQFLVRQRPAARRASTLDRGPGTPIPPLSIFAAGFAGGAWWHQEHAWTLASGGVQWPLVLLGSVLLAAGVAAFAWGMRTFARARTGILLQRAATRVISHGPYRWSRNPMYVGCVAMYVGATLALNSVWPLLVLPVVVVVLTALVITREERYMQERFGAEYEAYCQRVPRWL